MRVRQLHLGSRPLGAARPVITIGNFDGLHLGHRHIIDRTRAAAAKAGEPAGLLTFEPHPVAVLHPDASFCRLKSLDQRRAMLAELGLDLLLVFRFDRELMQLSPRAFAERVLAGLIRASTVLVGPNFRFGHRRAGDLDTLRALGHDLGFTARSVRGVRRAGRPVSSTRIRDALKRGDVRTAATLLGRPFAVDGRVVRGAGRGRQLGFATANLELDGGCRPGPGVYGTIVAVGGRKVRGATFIGRAETFGAAAPTVETHLLDWRGRSLYGRRLRLEFVTRVRDAAPFPSAEALKAQIARDLIAVRRRVRIPPSGSPRGRS